MKTVLYVILGIIFGVPFLCFSSSPYFLNPKAYQAALELWEGGLIPLLSDFSPSDCDDLINVRYLAFGERPATNLYVDGDFPRLMTDYHFVLENISHEALRAACENLRMQDLLEGMSLKKQLEEIYVSPKAQQEWDELFVKEFAREVVKLRLAAEKVPAEHSELSASVQQAKKDYVERVVALFCEAANSRMLGSLEQLLQGIPHQLISAESWHYMEHEWSEINYAMLNDPQPIKDSILLNIMGNIRKEFVLRDWVAVSAGPSAITPVIEDLKLE